MREEESKAVRGRGRPARPPEEAREAAVQAATWLLLHEGYAATTMEAVARHAGMAKKSLYQYAANREELVALVVRGWTDAFLPAMAQDAAAPGEVLPLLKEILQAMAARVLTADAVGLFRLLCTEFPARADLLAVYQRNGIERGTALLAEWLRRQAARGHLVLHDGQELAGLLLAMVIAEPLRQMALDLLAPVPSWDAAPRIDAALRLLGGSAFSVAGASALRGG
ncbi:MULTISPECIES: TetR/AcrR family transcriptional regulator [Janthinobacterium]|uniref:TetR/AcrR family transcriptional regulator n=1 Tax=Janthinobacterium TaxID=29580 RepID=UPI000873F8E0|nr:MULTISPECIES: TetR/AcrR family transcriptional regulator [Janthinobacterium]MCC7697334.1 TetR/AcrR family transcriptional regulator [Janthinobacterium sp. EB271-G4-7A]MCC7713531.1 TetR/AcrR family transcriptional regulator [Janthinobacterium lividum]OEZ52398.1 bacterial regulatory protein, tetR family [Janthinobacterium lividum]WQE26594.1 TetR/AcrR family transcriptional regulator [Janthinobacterium lividum]STQ97486.1 Bacterial regulatory proteins, tetR family [Janthinobacterium lividum]